MHFSHLNETAGEKNDEAAMFGKQTKHFVKRKTKLSASLLCYLIIQYNESGCVWSVLIGFVNEQHCM